MISTHLFLLSNGDAQHCDGECIWSYENTFVLTLSRVLQLLYSKCNLYLLYVFSALLR